MDKAKLTDREQVTQHITIIGAGIGGLTTALILKQKGIPVTVYESASEIKPVGAGIVMANNAMQIFQKIGLQHKIERAGNIVSSMVITDEKLTPISTMELAKYQTKYGVQNIAIHRGELQKILAEEIGFENIRLSKHLSKIERHRDAFELTFADNTTASGNIVIGADGIKSTVRNQLFQANEIRDTRQVCWRGICDIELSEKYDHKAIEAWGKGKRFGAVKISDKKVYWYAVVNERIAERNNVSLSELFQTFHPDVLAIIAATPQNSIFLSKITDLKPIIKWQHKNVCLIGDAAHATTPNMGQGACQAVEDAYTIGQLLGSGNRIDEAFSNYESLRIKKAHHIVKTSWAIGKLAHIENSFGVWLRNTIMRATPKSASTKQLDKVFDITYI